MDSRQLTDGLKELALRSGADLVGVAPVERMEKAPAGQRPRDHLPEAKFMVVIAKHIPDASIERWGKPPASTILSYRSFGHGPLNLRLVFIQEDIVSALERGGYEAYPVTPLGGQVVKDNEGDTVFQGDFSNRHAAAAAGLGEFGWSALALTPEFGPRQRFATVLTDAPLIPDPLYKGPGLCDECHDRYPDHPCAEACPMGAISADEYDAPVDMGERTFRYGKVDHWKCYWCEVEGLIKEGGPMYAGYTTDVRPPAVITPEEVLKAMNKKDPWQTKASRGYQVLGPWCGRCLHVCTYGRETYLNRLKSRRG